MGGGEGMRTFRYVKGAGKPMDSLSSIIHQELRIPTSGLLYKD